MQHNDPVDRRKITKMKPLYKVNSDIRTFGRSLMTSYRDSEPSFESAAQRIGQEVYNQFPDEDGNPIFALLRTYRLCNQHEFPPEYPPITNPSSERQWLALVASVGDEQEWNDRLGDKDEAIIPVDALTSPLLKAAFEQLTLQPGKKTEATAYPGMITRQEKISPTHYFYVEHALENPNIINQDTLIKPYGIESVLGIGCPFLSGSFQISVFFSKIHLTPRDVQFLIQLAPFISAVLSTYDEKGLYWN
jgi:hypothetical protein